MSTIYPAIKTGGAQVDLSQRIVYSTTVAASPSAGSITGIATLTIPLGCQVTYGVELMGWAAFTGGTNGVSALLGIRQTGTSGSLIASSGAQTIVATDLYAFTTMGFDTAPPAAGVYELCLTIGSGSATSTVSAVYFRALVI